MKRYQFVAKGLQACLEAVNSGHALTAYSYGVGQGDNGVMEPYTKGEPVCLCGALVIGKPNAQVYKTVQAVFDNKVSYSFAVGLSMGFNHYKQFVGLKNKKFDLLTDEDKGAVVAHIIREKLSALGIPVDDTTELPYK